MGLFAVLLYSTLWPFQIVLRLISLVILVVGYPIRVVLLLMVGSAALIIPLVIVLGLLFAVAYYFSVSLDGLW